MGQDCLAFRPNPGGSEAGIADTGGVLDFEWAKATCGLMRAKSSLPAIKKSTVRIVSKRGCRRAPSAWRPGTDHSTLRGSRCLACPSRSPSYDAVEVVADQTHQLFHGLDLGAHDAGAPCAFRGSSHVVNACGRRLVRQAGSMRQDRDAYVAWHRRGVAVITSLRAPFGLAK